MKQTREVFHAEDRVRAGAIEKLEKDAAKLRGDDTDTGSAGKGSAGPAQSPRRHAKTYRET